MDIMEVFTHFINFGTGVTEFEYPATCPGAQRFGIANTDSLYVTCFNPLHPIPEPATSQSLKQLL
jgi:hypothetical protein